MGAMAIQFFLKIEVKLKVRTINRYLRYLLLVQTLQILFKRKRKTAARTLTRFDVHLCFDVTNDVSIPETSEVWQF
jgi:hypothetical protein